MIGAASINAGSMREYITIISPSSAPDSAGQRNATFTTLRQCWAEVIQLSGKELMEARQVYAATSTRVRVRFEDGKDLNAGMRIQLEGRTLNILSVIDVNSRRKMVEMLCEEPG